MWQWPIPHIGDRARGKEYKKAKVSPVGMGGRHRVKIEPGQGKKMGKKIVRHEGEEKRTGLPKAVVVKMKKKGSVIGRRENGTTEQKERAGE